MKHTCALTNWSCTICWLLPTVKKRYHHTDLHNHLSGVPFVHLVFLVLSRERVVMTVLYSVGRHQYPAACGCKVSQPGTQIKVLRYRNDVLRNAESVDNPER